MQSPRDELLASIEATLKELVPGLATPRSVASVVIEGWKVERKSVELKTEAQPGDPDVYLVASLPARAFTDEEKAKIDEVQRLSAWAVRPEGPPPANVGWLDLLGQRVWWMSKDGTAHRISEMHTSHLANTLALLERSANKLNLQAGKSLIDAPDEVQDEFEHQSPEEWLRRQPLIKRMRKELKLRERLRRLDGDL